MGQLIVVMFLFYSGYGVMYSIMNKGEAYVRNIPKRRLLNTLLNFMVAVAIFLALQSIVLDNHFDLSQILLSLIGWESLGNSNWYIFVILLCYAWTYVAFRSVKDYNKAARLLIGLCFLTILPLMLTKGNYWYDTILSYPFGVLWCLNREKIDRQLRKNGIWIFIASLICFMIFCNLPLGRTAGIAHNFRSLFFITLIVMGTTVLPVQNTILAWLGRNLFPLYIYQRLPMIYLSQFDGGAFCNSHPYIFMLSSLAIVIMIASIFKYFEIRLK